MHTALVTTTIHVPRILELLRKYGPEVRFFIAGDEKSPDGEMMEWMETNHEHCAWLSVSTQQDLNYKCSEIIGWNCIQRRNIALLEALKWGAEVIITIDDDNYPMNSSYFRNFESVLSHKFDGLQIGDVGWTDIGQLMYPRDGVDPVVQRGTPQPAYTNEDISFITNAKVGLAQGIILGAPDTSAIDRISRVHPQVHQVSELLREGVVLGANGWAATNSQNTAFIRKFAPAMFMMPGIGRGDDIIAGLLTQRIMREQSYHVHFGRPFCFQQRNKHDLVEDLKNEMWLIENVRDVADFLDHMSLASDIITSCRYFFGGCACLPQQAREAGLAWCEDCELLGL